MIELLKTRQYDVIFDDDNSGEIADVIAIREEDRQITIDLFHCKYSGGKPGKRIKDLYEVCGQAQKCIHWRLKVEDFFLHMQRRDYQRKTEYGDMATRFEVGDNDILQILAVKAKTFPTKINIHVVQPGLSKSQASREQLELLSVTENHLLETFNLPFYIIGSP